MSTMIGRTRSTIDLRKTANWEGLVVGNLGPNVPVEVLADQGEWLKVQPYGYAGAVAGYAPRLGVALPAIGRQPLFPLIQRSAGLPPQPAIPAGLSTAQFTAWLSAGGPPPWIAPELWNNLAPTVQKDLPEGIRSAISARQAAWEAWLGEVAAYGRANEAVMDEWITIQEGGKNVASIRPERMYSEAASTSPAEGWISTDDIMVWSGCVQRNDADAYKLWYQVSLYKLGKLLEGWFRAELIDPYTFPTMQNTPDNPVNAQQAFDLSRPRLRFPEDPEIAATLANGYSAAQYIDVRRATGKGKRNFNLCGEFCVAALLGWDIIPTLQKWLPAYAKATTILKSDIGTNIFDLETILQLAGIHGEPLQYSPIVSTTSPQRLCERTQQGQMAICGVVINQLGKVEASGAICHWVILEDVLPVGNNGWVRLYNPYRNREEVYAYTMFMDSMAKFPHSLWINQPPGMINA